MRSSGAAFLIPAGGWADLFGRRRFSPRRAGCVHCRVSVALRDRFVGLMLVAAVLQAGGGDMMFAGGHGAADPRVSARATHGGDLALLRRKGGCSARYTVGRNSSSVRLANDLPDQFAHRRARHCVSLRDAAGIAPRRRAAAPDVPGSILLALIIGDIVLIMIEGRRVEIWTSPPILLCALGAASMTIWFRGR